MGVEQGDLASLPVSAAGELCLEAPVSTFCADIADVGSYFYLQLMFFLVLWIKYCKLMFVDLT